MDHKGITKLMVVFICFFAFETSALAQTLSGTVTGRLTFYNNQGGFCPSTGRNCTGAKYPQSEHGVQLGIRNVRVEVLDSNGAGVIGTGVTDSNGYFEIFWSMQTASHFAVARVQTFLQEGNNRFQVFDSDGTTHRLYTGNISLSTTSSSSNPQNLGSFAWGNSVSANAWANIYDGAWRTWNYALKYSGLMLTHLNGVKIYGISPNAAFRNCPTSCAWDGENIIIGSFDQAFNPQSRIMHEFGHIASDLASPDQDFRALTDYCWPNTGGGCQWSSTTPEWGADQFEEGFALFVGLVAMYWFNSPDPHYCLSSTGTSCVNSVETTSTCGTNSNRLPINVLKYLWDLYDSNSDGSWENTQRSYGSFFSVINDFNGGWPSQHDNRGKNEPFNMWGWVDDRDGRSAWDFHNLWEAFHGSNDYSVRSNNCLAGVGD